MNNTKTFRLFISSTFSDFKKERQTLQLKVFPEIKKYCSDKGYKFQPIDLRWGVSNEAQLDQKTLELCLNEVRACKSHPHPNFLVMIGDRYGWIPLPYMIEKVEFENLSNTMNDEEKRLVLEWYREDLNQIPASYILQSRSNEFVDCDLWQEVENKLRIILQNAVKVTNLSEEQSRKYYLSATEAEVEEGIIPYHSYTEYQKQLISDDPSINEIDPVYIFGFLRDSETISLNVSDNEYANTQQFKNRVKDVLPSSNIFHKQIHDIVDEFYLIEFEERVIAFLKVQIDRYEDNTQSDDLQQEIEAQAYFAQQKRKNFLAQETVLEAIASYIADTNNEPLIIYGPSGRGKSSIMAKAIEAAENTKRKICYRFIGATPHSSSTKEVLTSIMNQLGINIQNNADGAEIVKNVFSMGRQQETFEEFSYRIYDAINALKENVIIFIDAVDQLVNEDQFLWLSSNLPENIKIIISALDDANYVEDSKYFEALKNKTNNLIEVPVFSEPIKLLQTILNSENRTLQLNQEAYFLKQFYKVQSPLYVIVAAQELKNWKSYDTDFSLADTQQGIIQEFLENLSTIYYHNEEFVQKVLGYIYASRDGLSEEEILQLISTDKEFVKQVAPEHFHMNETGDLPLVIWTRLHTQLKPFLSSKYQDGEKLLYFFHREFEEEVGSNSNQQREHEEIIKVIQKLIETYQYQAFESNRYGKLYITLLIEYDMCYQDEEKQNRLFTFIENPIADIQHALSEYYLLTIDDDIWFSNYIMYFRMKTINSMDQNKIDLALSYSTCYIYQLSNLFTLNQEAWGLIYFDAVNNLGGVLNLLNQTNLALLLFEKILPKLTIEYKQNKKDYFVLFFQINLGLATFYNRLQKSEFSKEILKKIDIDDREKNFDEYIALLQTKAVTTSHLNDFRESIRINQKIITLLEAKDFFGNDNLLANYLSAIYNLSSAYAGEYDFNNVIILRKRLYELTNELYNEVPSKWIDQFVKAILGYIQGLTLIRDFKGAKSILEQHIDLINSLYSTNNSQWLEAYIRVKNIEAQIEIHFDSYEAERLFKKNILLIQNEFQNNEHLWNNSYANALVGYIRLLLTHKRSNELIVDCTKELYYILKPYMSTNPEKWKAHYTFALNILNSKLNKNQELLKQIQAEILEYSDNFFQDIFVPKINRNDPCPCGSGKKYKKCCSKNT